MARRDGCCGSARRGISLDAVSQGGEPGASLLVLLGYSVIPWGLGRLGVGGTSDGETRQGDGVPYWPAE
jgi:hypothetical protein